MKVYFGRKGSDYYILCPDFKECYKFDMFGVLKSDKELIGSCNNWVDVDSLSFVDRGNGSCELLFNDKKAVIQEELIQCAASIRKFGNYLGTMFTVNHSDSEGMYTQILFVAHKGIITKSMLEKRFSISNWNSLF